MASSELGRLADDLIEHHRGLTGALLVRIEPSRTGEGIDVGIRPLDDHPADALARFRVPRSWTGLGVVCGGWGAPTDGIRPSAHPEARRVVVVLLLGRDGTVEGRVRWPDGTILRDPPGEGLVLEAMRAALGLSRC
jgi:hypothetical protein